MPADVVSEDEVVFDRARGPVVARDYNRSLLALTLEVVPNRYALASSYGEMVQQWNGRNIVLTRLCSPQCLSE